MRKVKVLIYRGHGPRAVYLYGQIRDAETDELIVSASAMYVTSVLKERGYQIVELDVEE